MSLHQVGVRHGKPNPHFLWGRHKSSTHSITLACGSGRVTVCGGQSPGGPVAPLKWGWGLWEHVTGAVCLVLFPSAVLRTEQRALHHRGQCAPTELCPQHTQQLRASLKVV